MISNRQLFLRHVAQTSDAPMMLEIAKAEGVIITDIHGREYMDFISGISVSNSGHRHPHVLAAINSQLDKYLHLMVYGEYIQGPQVKLASQLALHCDPLDSFYFVNSGTEAVEGAIKLARRATGRMKLVSFKNAYHGSTTGALSLMSNDYFTAPFHPLLPGVIHIDPFDENELRHIDENTAAVFVEFIRGEGGAVVAPHNYISALRKRCDDTGTLLVADEIQTGFGRTGPLFAYQDYACIPDILLMAKGMGGGMPIGAFAARQSLMSKLSFDPVLGHLTTFGGHPLSCAAASANLEVILDPGIKKRVPVMEQIIRAELKHPLIRSISGKGLLLAADLYDQPTAFKVIRNCLAEGLITDWFLFAPHKLRIAPPLTITDSELSEACKRILRACRGV